MNMYRKNILIKKAYVLCGITVLCGIAYLAVRHYMYVLDSYIYTLEFHMMFFKNNIRSANVALLAEYFSTLGPLTGFPNLILAEFISHYVLIYSAPSLVPSLMTAFGQGTGFILCLISSSIIGFFSYGLGWFFLGDILPACNISIQRDRRMYAALGVLFAVPYLTMVLPSILASFLRVRISVYLTVMFSALIIRSIWPAMISFSG